jgi:hypothetical protein
MGSMKTMVLDAKDQRYTISGLMPGWTYAFKVQAISESGMSLDPGWQTMIVAGGLPRAPDPPEYDFSDGRLLQVKMASIESSRNMTGGSEIVGYNIYVTADDRKWPTVDDPVVRGSHYNLSLYEHDCEQTPDYSMLSIDGRPTMVDRRFGFVYMKVGIYSASGLGNLSEAATLFCAPRPEPPVLTVANVNAEQVTLRWPEPELYNVSLVGYNIYMDDTMGGEIQFYRHLPASNLSYDVTNSSVVVSLYPLQPERHYRLRITTVTLAAESTSAVFPLETCRVPSTPMIYRLPSSNSVWLQWDLPRKDTVFCHPIGYQIVAERIPGGPGDSYLEQENGTNWTVNTFEAWSNITELLGVTDLSYEVGSLVPMANYRFKVRSVLASGERDSGWTAGVAAGVPNQMPVPVHTLAYSSASAVYLSWPAPSTNGGELVGYELFRNDGPGTNMRTEPEGSCIAAVAPTCTRQPCEFANVQQVPHAAGCSVAGLRKDVSYRFKVRAINSYGPGPLSAAAEVPVGTVPSVKPPFLASAAYENCTMTWRWNPALENGRLAHSYDLRLQSVSPTTSTTTTTGAPNPNISTTTMTTTSSATEIVVPYAGYPSLVWALNGSFDTPYLAMEVTVNESWWPLLIPGNRYRAAIRARSEIGTSAWSDWSSLDSSPAGYCLSAPVKATGLRRDPSILVRAGRVQLSWDAVTTRDQAGGDDPDLLGVEYDVWGKATPEFGNTSWRRLTTIVTHQADPLGVGGAVPVYAGAMVDTYPETAVTAFWVFKVRYGNRNGAYGDFSDEILLSTGQLPSAPRALTAVFAASGNVLLSWQIPALDGYTPLLGYQARCNSGSWEDVPNSMLSHDLQASLLQGLARCEVRAVNNVGSGPSTTTSITVL